MLGREKKKKKKKENQCSSDDSKGVRERSGKGEEGRKGVRV